MRYFYSNVLPFLFLIALPMVVLSQRKIQLDVSFFRQIELGKKIHLPNNGAPLKNGKYHGSFAKSDKDISLVFRLKRGKIVSPISILGKNKNVYRTVYLDEAQRVKKIQNYSHASKGPKGVYIDKILSLDEGASCRTILNEQGRITHKECTKDNETTYLFQCSVYTREPKIKHCEEIDRIAHETRIYKNYVLHEKYERIDETNPKIGFLITYYENGNVASREFHYEKSIHIDYPDGSYSIEEKEDSRTESIKVSRRTKYTPKGEVIYTERLEKQRFFDGITILKRIRDTKTIVEKYNNSMELMESKEVFTKKKE